MELRHFRYFAAVAEVLSFTTAASQLRIAQPSLSRQVRDLEDEVGVKLLKRSRRGVTLTNEGKLFLADVRDLLRRTDAAVGKVRAVARGEYGRLHVGYAPGPTAEIMSAALSAFQKASPRVKVLLHDLSDHEITRGLRSGDLELGIMLEPVEERAAGIQFEPLRHYPACVVLPASHPFARLKSVPVEKLATEWIVGFRRKDYPEFYPHLNRIYAPVRSKPRISAECDSVSSLINEVEAGRGIAVVLPTFKLVSGKRLIYRPITGTDYVGSVGIARATKGDVSPAGEQLCEILRKNSKAPLRRR